MRAREADSLAAFGGIIGLNRTLDEDTARAIVSTFIEAVIAPDVDDAARTILATKANLRVVVADFRKLADTARVPIDPRRDAGAGARSRQSKRSCRGRPTGSRS